jgi:hypothetical protein
VPQKGRLQDLYFQSEKAKPIFANRRNVLFSDKKKARSKRIEPICEQLKRKATYSSPLKTVMIRKMGWKEFRSFCHRRQRPQLRNPSAGPERRREA